MQNAIHFVSRTKNPSVQVFISVSHHETLSQVCLLFEHSELYFLLFTLHP